VLLGALLGLGFAIGFGASYWRWRRRMIERIAGEYQRQFTERLAEELRRRRDGSHSAPP